MQTAVPQMKLKTRASQSCQKKILCAPNVQYRIDAYKKVAAHLFISVSMPSVYLKGSGRKADEKQFYIWCHLLQCAIPF